MPIYADTLSDLKYSQGMVSFKLSPADHPTQVNSVHIPFSDLKNMVSLLFSEVPKIEAVHINWIAEQTRPTTHSSADPVALPPTRTDALGQKIGSV